MLRSWGGPGLPCHPGTQPRVPSLCLSLGTPPVELLPAEGSPCPDQAWMGPALTLCPAMDQSASLRTAGMSYPGDYWRGGR